MGLQGQGRRCWRARWRTTQTAPSSGCPAASWCRSTLARAPAWFVSSLLWPGVGHIPFSRIICLKRIVCKHVIKDDCHTTSHVQHATYHMGTCLGLHGAGCREHAPSVIVMDEVGSI